MAFIWPLYGKPSSLSRMARKARAAVRDYPFSPASEIRRYYKIINALAFVPEDEVLNAWDQQRPQLPSDLSNFATYFEYTWVGSRSRDPLFSIPTWNQDDASLMR